MIGVSKNHNFLQCQIYISFSFGSIFFLLKLSSFTGSDELIKLISSIWQLAVPPYFMRVSQLSKTKRNIEWSPLLPFWKMVASFFSFAVLFENKSANFPSVSSFS